MRERTFDESESPYFSTEHASFREDVRKFFDEEIVPNADAWEKQRKIPNAIWKKMAARGLLGISYPSQLGGRDLDIFFSVVFLEELGRTGYGGFRAAVSVHQYMATAYIEHQGSDFLKAKYLAAAISGDKIAALAITEPTAGSDVGRLSTRAERRGDYFLLNGEKVLVTNGTTADFYTIAARTAPRGINGISLFVMDSNAEGIMRVPVEKIGWHCSDTANLTLTNVRVPCVNIIGKENCASPYITHCMQLERLAAATMALGESEFALDITIQYMRHREAFGMPVSRFQALRHRIANLAAELAAVRQLVYNTAWKMKHGRLPLLECSMAKLRATELAKSIVDACLQMHGGRGYIEGHPISRLFRDIRATTLAGGTSEVMCEIIARVLMGPDR